MLLGGLVMKSLRLSFVLFLQAHKLKRRLVLMLGSTEGGGAALRLPLVVYHIHHLSAGVSSPSFLFLLTTATISFPLRDQHSPPPISSVGAGIQQVVVTAEVH